MNKKVSLGAAISFAAIIAAVTFIITINFSIGEFNLRISDVRQRESMYKKVAELDTLIRKSYDGKIDEAALLDAISKGYVNGINDKYARYFTSEELKRFTEENEGTLVGIGVSVEETESGYLKIVNVYDNSPANTAGFKSGDLIIKIGNKDIATAGYSSAVALIKGNAGTKVKITIRRGGVDKPEQELIRKQVVIPSIEYKMVSGSNGYIKITDFNTSTITQFTEAVNKLQADGARSLIFDLRNNSGGTLESVTRILDILLPVGDIATATYPDGRQEVIAKSDEISVELPMFTIGNGNSASASELFIAALRDYKKAQMIGTKTYGKGVMQTTFPLSDGSGVSITTAHFNPPSNVNFNGKGIEPDYSVPLTSEQEIAILKSEYTKDPQIMKAIEVANTAIGQ